MKKIQSYLDYESGVKRPGVVGVVYGNPESGKSSCLMTLTKSYKTLYFDVEGLAATIFDRIPDKNKNAKNLFISGGLEDLNDVLAFLETKEAKEYDVIIIDSISYLVGVMTAKANPAALKGNAVFAFYRDIGRLILLILAKAKENGINLFMAFQASDDLKKNGGAWGPKMDGNEGPDRIKELSNIMVYLEKSGFGKRVLWQDTDESFAYTKSKGLPDNHAEKIEFDGLNDFSFDFILGDKKLPTRSESTEVENEFTKDLIDRINKCLSIDDLKLKWDMVLDMYSDSQIPQKIVDAKDAKKDSLTNVVKSAKKDLSQNAAQKESEEDLERKRNNDDAIESINLAKDMQSLSDIWEAIVAALDVIDENVAKAKDEKKKELEKGAYVDKIAKIATKKK